MDYKELLDTSIVDSMPPFPPIDGIIGRERRRRHRRHLAAAGGAALAVLGLVAGAALVRPGTGEPSGDPPPPITTADASQGPETDRQTSARLDATLRARLAIVAPGSTLSSEAEPLLDLDTGGFAGFRTFSGLVTVTMDTGTARITVNAMRPETPQTTDTGVLQRVFGGCAGLGFGTVSQVESCTEETDPSGARITRATRGYGPAVAYEVMVIYPDGSAVTGETMPVPVSEVAFTIDQLAALMSDPALIP